MSNNTILITGATDGIGKQAAMELAKKGNRIIVHGRSSNKLADTEQFIKEQCEEADIFLVKADFKSLKEVSEMCQVIKDNFEKIDLIFHNAAIFEASKELTTDGFESNFQVNHLSTVLITKSLESLLLKAEFGRLIFVSSMLHSAELDFNNLQGELSYKGSTNYAISKLCNVLTANFFGEYFDNTTVTSNSMHPGVVETKLLNAAWSGGESVEMGATKHIYLAESEILKSTSGLYFENGRPMQSNPISYDKAVQKQLLDLSFEIIKKYI